MDFWNRVARSCDLSFAGKRLVENRRLNPQQHGEDHGLFCLGRSRDRLGNCRSINRGAVGQRKPVRLAVKRVLTMTRSAKPQLNSTEQEMFVGALNVAVELRGAEHEQHRNLGSIIVGLCAIINKYIEINRLTPS
jgi:hypothetical protein